MRAQQTRPGRYGQANPVFEVMDGLLEVFLWFSDLSFLERIGVVLVISAFAMLLAVLKGVMEWLPPQYMLGATALLYIWFKTRPTAQ